MKITAIDLFYLALPEVTSAADGTQDTILARVRDETGLEGWGESDASPLVTMTAFVCPTSHGNIVNLREILLGETIDGPDDIARLNAKVLRYALDIGQRYHALSAADIALWDLLGKKRRQPVWRLLEEWWGNPAAGARAYPKTAYASVLFEDTPEATAKRARELRGRGFRAAKFGWGPMGKHGLEFDAALVAQAREGLGADATLLVDAGVAWGEDDQAAYDRCLAFAPHRIGWLEEPFMPEAVTAYGRLKARRPPVPIAGGEGCTNYRAAEDLVENGKVDFIQVDAGRIGGITTSFMLRKLAEVKGITYVNHTFKSRLSLAAALHVFATAENHRLLEYFAGGSQIAENLARGPYKLSGEGTVLAPDLPGLGVEIDPLTIRNFNRPVRIEVGGKVLLDTGEHGR